MRHSKQSPQVNAGSMADIAFLLLIFFLVTATISSDEGLNRQLPKDCPTGDCNAVIADRNILTLLINDNDEIMLQNDRIEIEQLKSLVVNFIDNNGDKSCLYCKGEQNPKASDNPKKAVISLQVSDLTTYDRFIEVQNELSKAYFILRSNYSRKTFNKFPEDLNKQELNAVREAYPFLLSEAETN
ncbi:biopolymer transporter ExbD [Tamlana sedimentorum]|uniref:Biopolymer transporter ExbD n=1 Tax=Neotamlana sedimentorum TaxID=1435349 RepID=A0A0D7WAD1_9FLAO|nr:biopolymer transporter ExbD [Tamlana sedimentorum]KJD36096.1 biopolymer transporter ExbD [Tamlana sedimentorum]